MSDTQVVAVPELEEILGEEIPCGTCGKSADLRSLGHGRPCDTPKYICITCWQSWLIDIVSVIARFKTVVCVDCKRPFSSVESFSNFRPF
jgi:DNA-directed RNA polymerase subunit RPC12/RpoP